MVSPPIALRAPVQNKYMDDPFEEGEQCEHHHRHECIGELPVTDDNARRQRDTKWRRSPRGTGVSRTRGPRLRRVNPLRVRARRHRSAFPPNW